MEENAADMSKVDETNQSAIDEWKSDQNEASNDKLSNNDNNEINIEKQMSETSIKDSIPTENQEVEVDTKNSENAQNFRGNRNKSKNYRGNEDNSGYRKGRGGFNKSKHGNNTYENSSGFNVTPSNSQNNGRSGRGRGRGFLKKFNEENESFGTGYNPNFNNRGNNTNPDHRGRGRGYHRGRGRKPFDGWYGNNEDGLKKKENDKTNGPKPKYIPPDIENQESIAGIEAGLNFNKYETIEVKVSGTDPPKLMMSFYTSGLHDILLENLTVNNFSTPTPIQNYAIPLVLSGKDMMASAQTGSGKTAAYVLPIIHNLLSKPTQLIFDENHCEPQVIIMAPTRELAVQIYECVWKFSKGTSIENKVLYGGTSRSHQKTLILRGVHILTTTPGRLNDFVDQGIVTFSSVKFFVLDEADRMLDMGFKPNIERILTHSTMTPIDVRQTLMFSATFASEIQHMATSYLKPDYIFVAVGEIGGACKDVVQTVLKLSKFEKKDALLSILRDMDDCQGTIVFVEEKRFADYIAAYLSEIDFPTTSIHGDREQPERELALKDFKTNKMKILVATAVAARGLDIKGVNNVVNLDLPKTIDEYVQRIGRTGRLGNAGKAISFFDPKADGSLASDLTRILKQAEQEVPSWLEDIANHIRATPTVDNFKDIRTNLEETSGSVPVEEEEEEPW